MIRKNGLRTAMIIASAASAVAMFSTPSRAAESPSFTLGQPVYMQDDTTSEPGVLQDQMRQQNLGGSTLDQYDLKIGGHAEVGYTFNFLRPDLDRNGYGQIFNDKSDTPYFNQLDLHIARAPLPDADRFDMGFKVELLFGSNARYTQANGTNFYGNGYANKRKLTTTNFQGTDFIIGTGFPGQGDPRNQLDILQAYVSINLPVAGGVRMDVGKFVTPWGIEKIDPTQNSLYSHSYIFGVSTPKTLTGITATKKIDEQWTGMGGIVVGWDQSLEDNNDWPSFVAQASYQMDEEWSFVFSGMVGHEAEGNRSDYRWLLDITADYKMAADTHIGIEGVFGYEPDVGTHRVRPQPGIDKFLAISGDNAKWFGVAGYLDYRFDPAGMFVLNMRGEYFNDTDGSRLVAAEVFSASLGFTIRPFIEDKIGKNLMFRPELRYDYSPNAIFDGGNKEFQWTIGGDIVFSF